MALKRKYFHFAFYRLFLRRFFIYAHMTFEEKNLDLLPLVLTFTCITSVLLLVPIFFITDFVPHEIFPLILPLYFYFYINPCPEELQQ